MKDLLNLPSDSVPNFFTGVTLCASCIHDSLNFTKHNRCLVVEMYIKGRKQCTHRSFMIFTHMVTIFQFLQKKIQIPKNLDLYTKHEDIHTLESKIYLRYVGRKVF